MVTYFNYQSAYGSNIQLIRRTSQLTLLDMDRERRYWEIMFENLTQPITWRLKAVG